MHGVQVTIWVTPGLLYIGDIFGIWFYFNECICKIKTSKNVNFKHFLMSVFLYRADIQTTNLTTCEIAVGAWNHENIYVHKNIDLYSIFF